MGGFEYEVEVLNRAKVEAYYFAKIIASAILSKEFHITDIMLHHTNFSAQKKREVRILKSMFILGFSDCLQISFLILSKFKWID